MAGMIKSSAQKFIVQRTTAGPQGTEERVEVLTQVLSRAIAATAAAFLLSAGMMTALAQEPGRDVRLPNIGVAPTFTLTTVDGGQLMLADLRGKVVAVTFIYATCIDTCPLLTAKLARVHQRLQADATQVVFVAITVDPERDTPAVLRNYAHAQGATGPGWRFLTGTPAEIGDVVRRYGVFARKTPRGDVDHTFLTSLVDRRGILRVQYLGVRFNPDEMLADLRALVREPAS